MNFRWILPGVLGIVGSLLVSVAAEAGTLQTWRFNTNENRLVFTTDDGVQPRAQLISDPTRLVIDLPGIALGRATQRQTVGGGIREVRVGQLDSQTTRIVIELEAGYTLDPERVVVRGTTPTEWSVQVPTPQRVAGGTPSPSPSPGTGSGRPATGPVQVESIQTTNDGFFIRTSGGVPNASFSRSRNRRELTLELSNASISSALGERELSINRNGVRQLELSQSGRRSPRTRITLDLSDRESGWLATVRSNSGILLVPTRRTRDQVLVSNDPLNLDSPSPSSPTPPVQPPPTSSQIATIQSIDLTGDGTQLLIRADRPITYRADRDSRTGLYRIAIPGARLDARASQPRLPSNSPLRQISATQDSTQTVLITVEPAPGAQLGTINQISSQILAVQVQRAVQPTPPPVVSPPPVVTPPPTTPPRVPSGRLVVVIDPGHGGVDPGAVGIGRLRETDVVLPISLEVARILEQQGIQVVLTRRDESRTVDLEPRVQIAEQARANLFVSIHANAISMDRPEVNGVETFYASDSGLRLAQAIQSSIIRSTGMNDRGVKSARFYVIRNTSMPAALVEVGFVTGAQDAPRLANAQFRSQMALAIAQGILQYVQQNL